MKEIPDQVEQCPPDEAARNDSSPLIGRRSQLPLILGIGGGAIAGILVGAGFDGLFMLLFLPVGAIIGGLLRFVGIFAGLGAILGFVLWVTLDYESLAQQAVVMLISVGAGSLVGALWTVLKRGKREGTTSTDTAAVKEERRRLASICLMVGPLLGAMCGVLLGGVFVIAGIVFGLIVGVALFFALALSGSR